MPAVRAGSSRRRSSRAETAVPPSSLRVEDPELRPPPRRPESVAGDHRLRPLADDVPPEPDPRPPGELEAEPGRFRNGGGEPGVSPGGSSATRSVSARRASPAEPAQPLGDAWPAVVPVRSRRQVHHEQVDRPAGEERAGDRQALVERVGGQDDEPVEADAPGDGLDRVERPGEVQPGDDRAVGLGLGVEPEGEGRRAGARRRRAGSRWRCAAARPARGSRRGPESRSGRSAPTTAAGDSREENGLRFLVRERRGRERPDDPRSCRAPACLEGRQSSRHVRGEAAIALL